MIDLEDCQVYGPGHDRRSTSAESIESAIEAKKVLIRGCRIHLRSDGQMIIEGDATASGEVGCRRSVVSRVLALFGT